MTDLFSVAPSRKFRRLPVLTGAAPYAAVAGVTAAITLAMAAIGVRTGWYVLLALICGVFASFVLFIALANADTRRTGRYHTLYAPRATVAYLNERVVGSYGLAPVSLRRALLFIGVQLLCHGAIVAAFLYLTVTWLPLR